MKTTKRGKNGGSVKAIETQRDQWKAEPQGDEEVRSWIKHVLVPAMVDEWLSEHPHANRVATHLPAVAQFERISGHPVGGVQ